MNLDSNSQVNTSVADPDPVLLKNIIPDKNFNPGFKLDVMVQIVQLFENCHFLAMICQPHECKFNYKSSNFCFIA
jgi:hypothetical protein